MEHIQEVLDQIESEVEVLRSKALKLKEILTSLKKNQLYTIRKISKSQ